MELKDKIKMVRKELDFTQEEFAKKINISRSYLANIERGRVVGNLNLICKVAEISGRDMEWFVNDGEKIDIKQYEVLDKTIDLLIEQSLIEKDKKIDEKVKNILWSVLDKEIALKLERKEKEE